MDDIRNSKKTIKYIVNPNKINHFKLTEAVIPNVMAVKYTVNSRGDLTGFLNLTIDNAPAIPRERAIFPDITLVIKKVTIGKIVSVAV